ncbi:SAE2-domain-containing protein [Hyphopichia burtonii NRRL Y-1933]|uniref:SAE2-domain-containing protein n=1 Tax=Hyphopichia burtonii NRRL Y-1933 TaxID=984485 RepID=A0A1E4RP00_9ASCO|nr:SAE2-domain-containing protein [Hyphopichia burtonii NRRL Y-1933]ODV68987.1 SAE2-domain-containing protein [Hyphopichia burtonii NRRL Y-1933]
MIDETLVRMYKDIQSQLSRANSEMVRRHLNEEDGRRRYEQGILEEYNRKLDIVNQEMKRLREENSRMKRQIQGYKNKYESPNKRQRVEKEEMTRSQYNALPTQYSSEDEYSIRSSPKKVSPKKSPIKEIIEDSEEEYEPIKLESQPLNDISQPLSDMSQPLNDITKQINEIKRNETKPPQTALQRKEFLRKYYKMKFNTSKIMINLTTNPITEKNWILQDFKENPKYVRPKVSKYSVMSKKETEERNLFYEITGESKEELTYSQIFDKFPSPPGFMKSDFPDTLETEQRRRLISERQHDRIKRRIDSALANFYDPNKHGEFVFQEDIINQYVDAGRFQ